MVVSLVTVDMISREAARIWNNRTNRFEDPQRFTEVRRQVAAEPTRAPEPEWPPRRDLDLD